MDKVLRVHQVGDYARYIGAPELHPLVSVIHYDELEHCRHSLNNYDVYAMFIGDEKLEDLSYGQLQYDLSRHALMCVAPGQIGGKTDTGEEIHTKGWALLFDTELLRISELGRRMADYHFFSYNTSEALLMSPEQRQSIVQLLEQIRTELLGKHDEHTLRIVVSQIEQVLELVARYYSLQISTTAKSSNSDLLPRFEYLLQKFYNDGLQRTEGLPKVKYFAQQLFLSPNYFGDLVRELTGESASSYIRRFLILRAQQHLASGATISETAERLGFDYPQHFTRVFKRYFGVTPSEYVRK
ncbi:MAG: AraC family transcriptional regulator [Bacteroidaceae bacterium]|nr:AraC family transcriptional regulator [Bacteroidaceae bacterium]